MQSDAVALTKLIMREYATGEVIATYPLDDYEEKWGIEYRMYHRVDSELLSLNADWCWD